MFSLAAVSLAAITVQPLIAFVWMLLPVFLLLRKLQRATAIYLAIAGIMTVAVPLAGFGWPGNPHSGYSSGGNWHGHYLQFVVNGVATTYGWLQYLEGLLIYGLHGLIGAVAFFFVWRRLNALTNGSSGLRGASSLSQGLDR